MLYFHVQKQEKNEDILSPNSLEWKILETAFSLGKYPKYILILHIKMKYDDY